MRVFSLFTGIGGFELALKKAGHKLELVGYSEVDKYAIQIYEKNFPEAKGENFGDISRLVFDQDSKGNLSVNKNRVNSLPDFDLLVGGSPCQDLSIAKNNRKGLTGEKSKLFFAYLEILKIKKPSFFIFENVASMAKKDRDAINEYFKETLGYEVEPMLIDSSLVSAQKRKRLYWFNWNAPQPKDQNIVIKRDLIPIHAWSKSFRPGKGYSERIRVDGKANTITCTISGSESVNFFPKKILQFEPRTVPERSDLFFNEITKEQKITPNEAEILQTFPIDWTEGVSTSQRYKQLGNSVTVNVLKHIFSYLIVKERIMQKVIMSGNVGTVEPIYTNTGQLIMKFSLADNQYIKGEKKTTWHNIVCFGKLAEVLDKHLFVGQKVFLDGQINYNEYEKEGVKRYYTNIIAHKVDMLTWKDDKDNNQPTQQNQQPYKPATEAQFASDEIPF